jgi:FG-GAP repeat
MPYRASTAKLVTLATVTLLAAASLVASTGATPAGAASCFTLAPSDFNGDGVSDAAIGAVGDPPFGEASVHVIYGTRSGLTADASGTAHDDQLRTFSEPGNQFGWALATGDFNGDGCSDLAVGDPDASNAAGTEEVGAVLVFYGSPAGLQTSPQRLDESIFGSPQGGSFADIFGRSLAVGDFNGDGISDLAVGALGVEPEGAVYVFPGGRLLPLFAGTKRFVEGDGTVPAAGGGELGWSMAAGDFNGDGRSDLAIGAISRNSFAGGVFVLRGSASTLLTSTGRQTWTQDSPGIAGTAESDDDFGWSVATGSFKGNGRTDLAIGVPDDSVNGVPHAGAVNVIYSAGAAGLSSAGNQLWTQDSTGLGGAEAQAEFGGSLAAGDFNANLRTDLAVGAVGATAGGKVGAGDVTILPGTTGGLTATGSSIWSQATAGIAGTAETGDNFGSGLGVLRVKSLIRDDLLVGVVGEGVNGVESAGAAHFIPGSASGLTATGSQLWTADSTGIKGTTCEGCFLGWSVD